MLTAFIISTITLYVLGALLAALVVSNFGLDEVSVWEWLGVALWPFYTIIAIGATAWEIAADWFRFRGY